MKKTIIVACAIFLSSCSGNNRAKNYGGSMKIKLPKGQKLMTITWKDESLWYLTRPMTSADTPCTTTFQENSPKGIVEGTVTIVESK